MNHSIKNEIVKKLQDDFPEGLVEAYWDRDELTLVLHVEALLEVASLLKEDYAFHQLIDVCGADYPPRFKRFDVVYHLLSLKHNQRIRLKVHVEEEEAVPSLVPLFSAAGWFERETFDMYGIPFNNHPDLRRILTDYDFEGFPLRKDFPLTGYVQVRYSEDLQEVVKEPVQLVQAFRRFDFLSPWEGARQVLPGDEKVEESK